MELHKKYIGREDEKNQFHPGLLLDFWKRCQQNPQQKFVCVIDNFDKINPETFFGPELWEHMSSTKEAAVLGGKNIDIPYFDETIKFDINKFGIINPNKDYVVVEKGLVNELNQKGNLIIKFEINYTDKTSFTQYEINDIKEVFNKFYLI